MTESRLIGIDTRIYIYERFNLIARVLYKYNLTILKVRGLVLRGSFVSLYHKPYFAALNLRVCVQRR